MNIIFLNGPSSSGKTSIARELQSQLSDYYLYFGIDAFIDAMPAKSNCFDGTSISDGFYWQDVVLPNKERGKLITSGDYGVKIEESYRVATRALLDCGNNLIADNVIDGNEEMSVWKEQMADHDCLCVGVFCSLEELLSREKNRTGRVVGSAAEQYFRTHKGVDYDLMIDTGVDSVERCADQIVKHMG